jgi:flagellar hook protein FlgE
MLSTPSISLSGMNAAQVRLNATGHNVANLLTDGFRRERVAQATTPEGGVSTSLSQVSEPGSALETDMVEQLQAKNSFLANLSVFRTSDRMMGALLDITA